MFKTENFTKNDIRGYTEVNTCKNQNTNYCKTPSKSAASVWCTISRMHENGPELYAEVVSHHAYTRKRKRVGRNIGAYTANAYTIMQAI